MSLDRTKVAAAVVRPTLPTVVSVGAEFTSTGVPTATLPGTHAANDILVLVLQSSNESNITAPTGYTQLGPQNAIGAAATAGTVKLSVFWKRDAGSESAPTIPDTGDHTYGMMFAVRGCPTANDPFHLMGNGYKLATSTTGTSPKGVTAVDNCLVVDIFGHAVDNASAQASAEANSDLASLTEQFDDGTTDGTGGGIVVVSGTKTTAGPVGATTLTWANTTVDVSTRVAFIPADTTQVQSSTRPVEVQTFLGTPADLDDTWVKPSGARTIFTAVCDGGASGSGGRSSATAAGGGGGGGGGYDEAWFNADELGATITVHAGKGGTVAAVDGVGVAGVLSEFDKGGSGPLTSARRVAGTAATAAASADGGNGGCGSGRGTTSPVVNTTRADLITLSASGSIAATGGIGGRGGSGTTAPVGGSPGEWGGGGGESGGDTDASITAANNGFSLRGGGGGGGGRTTTNVGGGAMGGAAAAPAATQGAAGIASNRLPYGGSGGCGGGSSVTTGGTGGFPGGGGGGGGGIALGTSGAGAAGCVVVETHF